MVFPKGSKGNVRLYLHEARTLSDFTMSMWVHSRGNSTPGLTITLLDKDSNPTWTFTHLHEVTLSGSQVGSIEVYFPNTTWHHFVVSKHSCDVTALLDLQPLPISPGYTTICPSADLYSVKISADADTDITLSQLNIWSSGYVSTLSRRCFSEDVGDLVAWKMFEEADIDGAFVQMPSECDELDNCLSSPCVHGACQDGMSTFSCTCEMGFTGARCETNIDDCRGHVCMNEATCEDNVLGYSCACPPSFTGTYCEINVVDGGWGEWGNWTECSSTCGSGNQARTRRCDSPLPENGGSECAGNITETRLCDLPSCPVCPEITAPTNSTMNCVNNADTITCIITCNDGFEFDIAPMDVYACGPSTYHEWNFETSFNPERRLPNCVAISLPEDISVVYSTKYRELYCSSDTFNEIAREVILSRVTLAVQSLTCMSKRTCQLSSVSVTDCSAGQRRRRSEATVGFQLSLSIKLTEENANETLLNYETSFLELQAAVDDGNLTADVLDDLYYIDVNQTDVSGEVVCAEGETQAHFYCVPCGRGTYKGMKECHFCPGDHYQDEEGQASCKPCPPGRSASGEGASNIDQCVGEKIDVLEETFKATAIIIGCVAAVVGVVILMTVYRRYRSVKGKQKVNSFPGEVTDNQLNGKLGPAKPRYQRSVTSVEVM